jgi:hypothetical protein
MAQLYHSVSFYKNLLFDGSGINFRLFDVTGLVARMKPGLSVLFEKGALGG